MMEEREDGELSESESSTCDGVEVYNPIARPNSNVYRPRNIINTSIPSSDEEEETSSSDSDSDFASKPKRPKNAYTQMDVEKNGAQECDLVNGARKKNNIWANVLQEEELTLEIGGVGLKKIKGDRNVESYDYTQAAKLYKEAEDIFTPECEEQETEEEIQKRLLRKRRFYDTFDEPKRKEKKSGKSRYLSDIEVDPEWTNKELGGVIADSLFEQKPELIVRVVEVLGRDKALEVYAKAQKIEKEGGMMILNGSRRRTSGGVYLQLLKSMEGVDKDHLSQIFADDQKETHQWRKRKRVNRKRDKQKSGGDKSEEDGFHLRGLFCDDPGGTKCPGSTPVTSPTASDDDDSDASNLRIKGSHGVYVPLKEVCERVASEISRREGESSSSPVRQEEMETC